MPGNDPVACQISGFYGDLVQCFLPTNKKDAYHTHVLSR